jgi:anthranilate synthase component 1
MDTPTREDFAVLARRGNCIPVARRLLADFETPLSAYQKLRGQGESFLFESVEGGEHLGRYSFVGCGPRSVIRQVGDRVEVLEQGRVIETYRVSPTPGQPGEKVVRDGLQVVEAVLSGFVPVPVPGMPRFTGGAVGFLGYEFIHDVEPVVPRPPKDELGTPTLYFLIADQVLVFDRVAQTLTVIVHAVVPPGGDPDVAYEDAVSEIDRLVALLEQPLPSRPVTLEPQVPDAPFVSNTPREQFLANVVRSKEFIRSGDIIQIVGSQRFSTPVKASPTEIYRAVRSINPSPYMFLLELEGFALVGASPELHVRCEDRAVEIRPIAGTRRRGAHEAEDQALEQELLADPKERAEHVMLVDLARNDIGRVCEYGSVAVRDLMVIERYSHVMHIVSNVTGELDPSHSAYDVLRATFPAGTVSGAPKIRAMQIINSLEKHKRCAYAGAVGYFGFDGSHDSCITLRTCLLKDGKAYVQAGAGVVADSDPTYEYNETVSKSKALLRAIALAKTIKD